MGEKKNQTFAVSCIDTIHDSQHSQKLERGSLNCIDSYKTQSMEWIWKSQEPVPQMKKILNGRDFCLSLRKLSLKLLQWFCS